MCLVSVPPRSFAQSRRRLTAPRTARSGWAALAKLSRLRKPCVADQKGRRACVVVMVLVLVLVMERELAAGRVAVHVDACK